MPGHSPPTGAQNYFEGSGLCPSMELEVGIRADRSDLNAARLAARVVYTFVGGRDPGQARIKQDTEIILRQIKRVGEFDTWHGKNWYYSDVKLDRVGEHLDQPTLEERPLATKDTVTPDLSGFEYNYQVMASPRVAH